MEKIKLFFNKKDGQFGPYWQAKFKAGSKEYLICVNEEVKESKFGEYRGGSMIQLEPKQDKVEQKQDKGVEVKDDEIPF